MLLFLNNELNKVLLSESLYARFIFFFIYIGGILKVFYDILTFTV